MSDIEPTVTEKVDKSEKGEKGEKKKIKKKNKTVGYSSYLHKVMKTVHPSMMISSGALACVNGFVMDLESRLSLEATELAKFGKKRTLSAQHVQTAVKGIFPGDMAGHAVSDATRAVTKYFAN